MIRLVKNFFINIGNILRRPRTVLYPKEKIIIPEGSRGVIRLRLDFDTLEIICNGCGLCEKACPQNCIEVKKYVDEDGNEKLDEFYLDLSKCIFCGSCIEKCNFGAIEMYYRYHHAEYDMESLKLEKLELIKQAEHSIRDFWSK